MGVGEPLFSNRLDRALRCAITWHRSQVRKQTSDEDPAESIPYVQHLVAVAIILDRVGYGEDVVIAGLLHDAVEDTPATPGQIREMFQDRVADLVDHCTEKKTEAGSRETRPWIDRKTEHFARLRDAPADAKAVVLADKLHNLRSMVIDLELGREVWRRFNAGPDQVIGYHEAIIENLRGGDPRLDRLAEECASALEVLRARLAANPASR